MKTFATTWLKYSNRRTCYSTKQHTGDDVVPGVGGKRTLTSHLSSNVQYSLGKNFSSFHGKIPKISQKRNKACAKTLTWDGRSARCD